MVLRWSVFLGAGLLVLAIIALLTEPGSWLSWCDLVGAWAAYFVAADIKSESTRGQRVTGPMLLSLALFGAWVAAVQEEELRWLTWWTFAFACAFLILGVVRLIKKEKELNGTGHIERPVAKSDSKRSA